MPRAIKVIHNNPDIKEISNDIIKYWQENNIFQKSVDNRAEQDSFIFYDGPPFANGLPHYGHLLTGYVKDAIARYKTMNGYFVERRFGWDCHGLPAEMGAEKKLGISGRVAIEKYGIEKFNNTCAQDVMKYTNEWEEYVIRQGRWVDFQNDYKTMDITFMESVIWAFKELYEKGLIYEDYKVVPYSWACQTQLSQFETRMDNSYRKKTSKSIYVTFTLEDHSTEQLLEKIKNYDLNKEISNNLSRIKEVKMVAWTTTPWTLPSNLALAVNKNMEYTCELLENTLFIYSNDILMSQEVYDDIFTKTRKSHKLCLGNDLTGLKYKPMFPYFANTENSFIIVSEDFVTNDTGTGIVHMAPAFGEDDFISCKKHNIGLVNPVDESGNFTDEVIDFVGVNVFEATDDIIKHLKLSLNCWLFTKQYIHNYPHCWRTDTPLIYKAVSSWYLKVTSIKDRMIELNKQINWIPSHIQDGQFGKWLENARDWAISRNRFWGTPIPIWKSNNPNNKKLYVFGSVKEIADFFDTDIADLHKHNLDILIKEDPYDNKYQIKRVADVLDCWFESGSMPYAQQHFPYDTKFGNANTHSEYTQYKNSIDSKFKNTYLPADFIVEYIAQTRGWFYTLLVMSTALFDTIPFKNCICHGVILDATGRKLSKRLNNYTSPLEIFDNYGSDSLRFLMLSSPVVTGDNMLLEKDASMVKDVLRLVIKPLFNSLYFLTVYANADNFFDLSVITISDLNNCYDDNETHIEQWLLNHYIIQQCDQMVYDIRNSMDNFDTITACKHITDFIEKLNNWFIRRSRKIFWEKLSDHNEKIKRLTYNALYSVLYHFSVISSSLLPIVTEYIYLHLKQTNYPLSVHLCDLPIPPQQQEKDHFYARYYDSVIIPVNNMPYIREICKMVLAMRNENNINTRQPLSQVDIIVTNNNALGIDKDKLYNGIVPKYWDAAILLIKEELNVKNISFISDTKLHISYSVKPIFVTLKPRLISEGKIHLMKEITIAIKNCQFTQENMDKFIDNNNNLCLTLTKDSISLYEGEYSITANIASDIKNDDTMIYKHLSLSKCIVCLSTKITKELLLEGVARYIVRAIQNTRKNKQLEITDKIDVVISTEATLVEKSIEMYRQYISSQTLANNINLTTQKVSGYLSPECYTQNFLNILLDQPQEENISIEVSMRKIL